MTEIVLLESGHLDITGATFYTEFNAYECKVQSQGLFRKEYILRADDCNSYEFPIKRIQLQMAGETFELDIPPGGLTGDVRYEFRIGPKRP